MFYYSDAKIGYLPLNVNDIKVFKRNKSKYFYTKSCNVQSYALHFNNLRKSIISINKKKEILLHHINLHGCFQDLCDDTK